MMRASQKILASSIERSLKKGDKYVVAAMTGINSALIWPVVLIGLGVVLVLFRSDQDEPSG